MTTKITTELRDALLNDTKQLSHISLICDGDEIARQPAVFERHGNEFTLVREVAFSGPPNHPITHIGFWAGEEFVTREPLDSLSDHQTNSQGGYTILPVLKVFVEERRTC